MGRVRNHGEMSETRTVLSGPEFHALGVPGWVHLVNSIQTRILTGSFAVGVRLLDQIAEVAEAMDHHPDLDLRYPWLDVRTQSHDAGGVTQRDVRLAETINDLAQSAGVTLDPKARQRVEIALDTPDHARLKAFWNAVHGLEPEAGGDLDEVRDPSEQTPVLWFQRAEQDSGQRFHLDLWVHPEEVPGRIAAAVAAGGSLVTEEYAPSFWVLADPEGNRVCLCTWQERG